MRKIITEETFNMVKALLKGGISGKECAKYLGLNQCTVSRIKTSKDLAEYNEKTTPKKATAQKAETKPQNEPEVKRETIMIQVNNYMLQEQKRTNELLTLISNKLAFIVDELTGVSNKGA